jgi:hypothetical protein
MLLNRTSEAEGRRFGGAGVLGTAVMLFGSILESIPIDPRDDVHECLIMIHRRAVANRMGEKDVGLGDLFSLCFAVMTVSELTSYCMTLMSRWFKLAKSQ